MLGPHQSPIYFTWINITNSIIFGITKDLFMLIKKNQGIRKDCLKIEENLWIKKIFEKWSGIKTIWKKIGVLEFIWKLKSRKLFETWGLEIKFKNWNFGN